MSTTYSRSIEDFNEFANLGAHVMCARAKQHIEHCRYADRQNGNCAKHEVWLDDIEYEQEPIMLYVYPLHGEPTVQFVSLFEARGFGGFNPLRNVRILPGVNRLLGFSALRGARSLR